VELSEAINLMYKWYQNAHICYVYLEDFYTSSVIDIPEEFEDSRWFTRGWTLQELIAPEVVESYNNSWVEIGTRFNLQQQLTDITGISRSVLQGEDPSKHTVAVRMSWATRRQTSREEDAAYCLLGIFGVNMPLLYGEGAHALRRLQEEILRIDEDYTLFAWSLSPRLFRSGDDRITSVSIGLLASAPRDYPVFETMLSSIVDKSRHSTTNWRREDLLKDSFLYSRVPTDHLLRI
jgi:hypothetical protein